MAAVTPILFAGWRHPGPDQLQPAGPPLGGEQLLGPVACIDWGQDYGAGRGRVMVITSILRILSPL